MKPGDPALAEKIAALRASFAGVSTPAAVEDIVAKNNARLESKLESGRRRKSRAAKAQQTAAQPKRCAGIYAWSVANKLAKQASRTAPRERSG